MLRYSKLHELAVFLRGLNFHLELAIVLSALKSIQPTSRVGRVDR